jgi:hypothetical protein
MREELGVQVPLRPLGALRVKISNRSGHLHCFQAQLEAPRLECDAGEIAEARWFGASELPRELGYYVTEIVALARGAPESG